MADEIKTLNDLGEATSALPIATEEVVTIERVAVRDNLGRSYATGKRKDAVARVWIKPGSGKVVVNGKEMISYFARPVLQMILRLPPTKTVHRVVVVETFVCVISSLVQIPFVFLPVSLAVSVPTSKEPLVSW